jgi:hypothetical protein
LLLLAPRIGVGSVGLHPSLMPPPVVVETFVIAAVI